jgi:four helix bundle protein
MGREVRRFTDLDVWREAHQLFVDLYADLELVHQDPCAETIAAQLMRSTGSVSANIAEGFNRSQKRFVNSLDIALGEANEAESWLYKLRDVGLVDGEIARSRLKAVIHVQRMLTSLKTKIAANPNCVREAPAVYDAGEAGAPFLTIDD